MQIIVGNEIPFKNETIPLIPGGRDGNRKSLFYTDCYPLVNSAQCAAGPLSIIKKHEDKCPWCGVRLTVLFDFALTDPVFGFFNFKGDRLRVSTCHICTCYENIFTRVDYTGYSK
ncbi:MAG: hypothetical protein GX144_06555 [Clostridiaceae bacterium]|jgi:hypothetical protein|nr:hypothetical protein [Clostridiaceae bacterium]